MTPTTPTPLTTTPPARPAPLSRAGAPAASVGRCLSTAAPRPPLEGGVVSVLKDGIVTVLHLKGLKAGEIVLIQSVDPLAGHVRALILNLNENNSQGILLGSERLIKEGALVYRSHSLFRLRCSLGLFGHVLDGLGDHKLPVTELGVRETSSLVEQKATGIIDREPVRIPLRTGIKAVDALIPIGRGQRELIIGDRQTGKSSIAIDAILNHASLNERYRFAPPQRSTLADLRRVVWFVYNAIGQKQSTVNNFKHTLHKHNALWFTAIVASTAAESAPLQFLSPYTACTLGEFIRDVVGGHCTVVYDDLSKHAVAYRQMSLLLRRPPGREAFPGDVFYVHSRLLERAGSLTVTPKQVRGTLTAFPVIETQAGDVSAYIPTNVISITDGQIFLETELFYRGIRPAVNVGLSVSRVGSAAQPGIMKKVAGSLKMELAQYREIEGFSKLGASLDESTQRILNRGESLIELLKQDLHRPLSTFEQVLSIFLGVGYSGSWFQEMTRSRVQRGAAYALVSRSRMRGSWLEWFRSLAPDFTAGQVAPFVQGMLRFAAATGVVGINLYPFAEHALLSALKRSPVVLFDDLVTAFVREGSTTNLPTLNGYDAETARTVLFRLRVPRAAPVAASMTLSAGQAVREEALAPLSLRSIAMRAVRRWGARNVRGVDASAQSGARTDPVAAITGLWSERVLGDRDAFGGLRNTLLGSFAHSVKAVTVQRVMGLLVLAGTARPQQPRAALNA